VVRARAVAARRALVAGEAGRQSGRQLG
jgi:hypothetical protein